MIYYGTEILMTGYTDPDAKVRADYPGGWESDSVDKFTKEGRSAQENEAYDYIKKLAQFRKKSGALKKGKTTQFVPVDGVYVYFRYNDAETIMVIMNSSEKEMPLDMNRYDERIGNSTKGKNVLTDEEIELENFKIGSKSLLILQLN